MKFGKLISFIGVFFILISLLPIPVSASSEGFFSEALILSADDGNGDEGVIANNGSYTCQKCMKEEENRCEKVRLNNAYRGEKCFKDLKLQPQDHCRSACSKNG